MKILAIDDRPDNLTVLKAVLLDRLPEAVLVTAPNGPEGLGRAASEDPDVILLDVVMPGMDGYDVCRRLKADAILKTIPVLFLTALADRESRIRAVEAGADGFLSKPFDEIELTVQILAMTKLRAANRLQRLEKEALAALVAERTREIERELAERKRAEELLRSSEELYRKLVGHLDAGVVVHGPDTSVITSNSRALELLGLSEGQMAGRQAMDREWKFIHEDHAPFLLQEFPVSRIIAEKKAIKNLVLGIVRPVSKDIVWVSVNGVPVFDQQGDILQVVVSFVDITERKQAGEALQESEKRMRAITDSAQDGIVMMDPQGRICYWNAAAERIFGYTSEEALGGNLHALIAPARYHPAHNAAFPAFLKTGQGNAVGKTLELEALRKDGSEMSVELSLSAIQVQGNWHAVGIIRDTTERKAMEAGLKEALLRAEAAAAAKSEFLSIMSHELRTPLNGVLGFSELLADTSLDEEQRACVETISNSGNHLLAIVNDILDLSSIEKGAMSIRIEPFAFAGLVKSSEQAVQKTALDKGVAFRSVIEPGVPEQLHGDERRIRQILINLLGNAVKFTSNGSVTLRVATVKKEGRRLLDFSVEDTGIGISPETMGLLFNPFTQADMKRNRTYGGTGLGLAISKRLAEAMGGTLTVTSTPGKGSTFTFRLPLETSLPSSAPGASATCDLDSALPSGTLVLVAEDDRGCSVLAGKMLQSLGCRAEFAADGAEAVKAFVPGKFSAILMDMAMPVMDGLDATRKIREAEADTGAHVPIIALTANVMPGDRERCLVAGMDAFISKPFKRDELAAAITRVVQR